MKNIMISVVTLGLLCACQPPAAGGEATGNTKELEDRLAKLEKKVQVIEKQAKAKPRRPEKKPQTAAYKIPVGNSPILGKQDAPVNVVIFSDFQCPFCSRVDPMLNNVLKDADLKDKVNVVFKHFPLSFHKDAKPAAKASMAAQEQGGEFFWKMKEKLYANMKALKPDNFKKWAKEIGLDVKKFEADLKANDAKYDAAIASDMKLGQTEAKVRGTPSIFVNGWELRQRSVDGVKALIKDKKLTAL